MKQQIISFIILALYILGTVGWFGYAIYCGAYLISIAIVALALMALPTARNCIEDLLM